MGSCRTFHHHNKSLLCSRPPLLPPGLLGAGLDTCHQNGPSLLGEGGGKMGHPWGRDADAFRPGDVCVLVEKTCPSWKSSGSHSGNQRWKSLRVGVCVGGVWNWAAAGGHLQIFPPGSATCFSASLSPSSGCTNPFFFGVCF